jgi:anti-anti-sigma regulatory factor
MIIRFDDDIKTDFEGYQKLVHILSQAQQTSDQAIVFDLANVYFFEANLCAVLAAVIEILEIDGKVISFINIDEKVKNILRKNTFLHQFGFPILEDRYDTSIKYQKFNPNNKADDLTFNNYIQNQLLNKGDFPTHSDALGKNITRNIFELYENARTHGRCNYIHTCGQYFPRKPDKPLNVTIVDRGVNIKENVNDFLSSYLSGYKAIEWAMQKGNTTKTGNISGGLGLDIIFEFVRYNNGKIQIISADGFWEWHNGTVTAKEFTYFFAGTIANIRFNLNDKKQYKMAGEISDLYNIF